MKKVFSIILFIFLLSLAVILYGRGFRVDLKKKGLKTTGLLAASSSPSGASIFINGRLFSATNETLNLEPGWYDVRLVKEGYIPWEKKMEIKKEVVAETRATLFPSNPSLSPLTSSGAKASSLSPDGTKIAYVVPQQTTKPQSNQATNNDGLYVLDLNTHPLSFSRKPKLVFSRKILPQDKVALLWSPDSTQVLLQSESSAFLLDTNKENLSPKNLIGTLPSLFKTWGKEKQELEKRELLALPESLIEIFTSSAKILAFSPDETKILYQATASATISKVIEPPLLATNPTEETREIKPGKTYVYDKKEDRNYLINEKVAGEESGEDTSEVAKAESLLRGDRLNSSEAMAPRTVGRSTLQWLPTSHHLILTEENQISILEYDGTNKATIFASPFEDSFVTPWPDGSRLIILTSLNPAPQTLPNLYSLSLK